jgi:purine-nucleoside/S-methyl-5'-thioadenosine phosphorylase / adenosine deaminase
MTTALSPISLPVLDDIPWLRSGVTTRTAALPLDGDMSLTTGAHDPESVRANRRAWLASIGSTMDDTVMSGLIHGTAVHVVSNADCGRGVYTPENTIRSTDGLITDRAGITLLMCYADCVPLIVVDTARRAIGLAHAGWRGTLAGMAGALVAAMRDAYRSDPADMLAAVGPSIGPDAYEIGDEVAQPFRAAYPDDPILATIGERLHLDLWTANICQLVRAGIPNDRVHYSGLCTFTHGDRFFSHRYAVRHQEPEGRFAVMIAIEE